MIVNEETIKDGTMEERQVIAIAHKDNLLRYLLPISTLSFDTLSLWQHEIFKYAMHDDALELYIEAKYEGEIDHFLQEKLSEPHRKEEGFGFVILVGMGLVQDPVFLAAVMKSCRHQQVMRITHSERSLELLLPSVHVNETVAILHQEFIG